MTQEKLRRIEYICSIICTSLAILCVLLVILGFIALCATGLWGLALLLTVILIGLPLLFSVAAFTNIVVCSIKLRQYAYNLLCVDLVTHILSFLISAFATVIGWIIYVSTGPQEWEWSILMLSFLGLLFLKVIQILIKSRIKKIELKPRTRENRE